MNYPVPSLKPVKIPSRFEVHQSNNTSSDIVFGMELNALVPDKSGTGTNQTPIYFTLDGSDPRLKGGAMNEKSGTII